MRGIKECLNWMVDNENKCLESGGVKAWFDGESFFRKILVDGDYEEHLLLTFNIFIMMEWKEVKQTYTFQEAADICRETGKRFKGEYNDMMNRNPEGEVYVWSLDGGDVVIDSEWTEV